MRKRNERPCFESWYFRELGENFSCEFIVRLNYDEEGRMMGSMDVHLPWGKRHFSYAHPVNMNLRGSLFLVLDKNVFTEACLHLDLEEPGLTIKGDIWVDREFGTVRLGRRRKIWAMEQELSGKLLINGREISFDGGKGYLEEVCGREDDAGQLGFWTQSNWFGERDFRIVCGGRGRRCFALISQDGYPVRLAGWKGAKAEYSSPEGFRISQGRYVLEGWRSTETDASGLDQTVRYRLRCGGDVLFDEISRRAGYRCE